MGQTPRRSVVISAKAEIHAIMSWPAMAQWVADAKAEPAEFEELDVEFCAGHASSSLRAMRLAALVCQNSVPIRA
jgi:hypothetical protein